MNIVDEYRNVDNKLDFFQSKYLNEQVEIIKELQREELYDLFKELSFDNIIRILREVDVEKKKEILSVIPEEMLKAIYRGLSSEEKQELVNLLEQMQADHLKNIDDFNQTILNSSESINNNYQNISTSQVNISNAIENQKEAQSKIKDVEKNKKRIEKLRKKLEKRAGKLVSKSCVGLFKKRNLRKLQNLQMELKDVNTNLDKLNQETNDLINSIDEYKNVVLQEKENIRKAQEEIRNAKKEINNASRRVQDERKASAKLDKEAKNVFGKKVYNKNVHLRGHYLTTMKQEEVRRLKEETERKAKEESIQQEQNEEKREAKDKSQDVQKMPQQQNVEKLEGEVVDNKENEKKGNDTLRQSVENSVNFVQMLQDMGCVQQPGNVPLLSDNNPRLVDDQTVTISKQAFVMLTMVAAQMYLKGYADAQKRQQEAQMALANGHVRTLSRGLVNITILILTLSVIAIILGILLIVKL